MLKNLKSLFIVEETTEEKKETPKQAKAEKEVSQKNVEETSNVSPKTYTNTDTSGGVDGKIIEKLLGAIEKNNLEGFDYLEFKKAIKALEKMPMDEATKFRSTFATASTLGVTLDKLVASTGHYISILENENTTFLKAFEGQLTSNVGDKEKEITQFDAIIKEKSEQIKKLTEEITRHQTQIEELKKTVAESKSKIDKTRNDFKVSYLHLRSQLEQDVEKMKQYLK
ncbi:hypothetical protein [Tenacibaculum sp. M341]|uniref:hypothetical protein n=1 Tax=Tenacibaculum sp. M341 TaxID=2530339 RepID=UPI0010465291|nr:hypothetical protein [Tenacibaculum sp. M341]TCI93074.1 hypothetical protein EYW44_05500 [Tenacibaculum sp. M341]